MRRPEGADEADSEAWPDLVVCPGGPLLVRGDHVVEDVDGSLHPTSRRISAVCRCGRTGTAPWCDGTHQQLPRHLRP